MYYRGKIINDIADEVGEDIALKVQSVFAGQVVHITIKKNSKLVQYLGMDSA